MGIEIRIEAADAADAQKQMAALLAGATPNFAEGAIARDARTIQETIVETPSRKARKPKADEGNASTSSTDGAAPSSGIASEPTANGTRPPAVEDMIEPRVEYADVQKAVTALAAARGRDAVMTVFDKFGVDHGTKLKPEQYVDAVAELEKAKEAA